MNVIELNNDNFEVVGTPTDLVEYYKEMIINSIKDLDIDAMESINLREFADLFRDLKGFEEIDGEKLFKVGFNECVMDGTASPYITELIEKEKTNETTKKSCC